MRLRARARRPEAAVRPALATRAPRPAAAPGTGTRRPRCCTATSPRCASTRPRTIASPRPPPPPSWSWCRFRGVRAASPRNATSNTRGRSSSGMPPHASVTASQPPNSSLPPLQRDRAVGRRVPDRVAQQVGHDPREFRLAAPHRRPLAQRRAQLDAASRLATGSADASASETTSPSDTLPDRQPQRARVDPGQLEQVVDELRHPVGLDPDAAVVVGDRRRVGDDAVLERLGHRPHAGERRTQVVRHPGDQIAAAGLDLSVPGRAPRRPTSRRSRAGGRATRPSRG